MKKKKTRTRKTQTRRDCDVVEEVPAACPRCKSTEREQLEGSITRSIKGVGSDGREFNRVRWSYCTCKACGQRYRVIRREMVSVSDTQKVDAS